MSVFVCCQTHPHPTSHVKEDGDQGPTSPPLCRCVNHMADDCLATPPPASSCNHALPPSAKAACGHTLASSSISTSRDSLTSAVHFLQQATSSLTSAVQLLDQATSSLAAAGCEDGSRQTGDFRCRSLSLPGRPLRPWDELTRLISVDSGSCDATDGSALNLMDRSRSCSYNMSTATYTTSATETDSSMDRPSAAPRRLPDGPRLVSYNSRGISFPMVLLLGKSPNDTVTVAASMAEISAPRNGRTDRCLLPKESKQKGLSDRPQIRKDKDNGHAPSGILGSLRRQLHKNNNSKTEREGPEYQPNTPPQKKSAKKGGRREDFSSVERHKRKVAKARERRATLVLGLVMAAFILCWLPFFLLYVASAFCVGCIPMMVFTVFFWIGYCNSALNPIIYTVFNRDFRRAFHRILCGRGPARP